MGYLESLLGRDERMLFTTRHHWLVFLGRVLGYVVLLILGLVLAVAGNVFIVPLLQSLRLGVDELVVRAALVAILVVYPAVLLVAAYIRWRGDRFIVTNLRVIHARGVLSKSVLDSSLEKVNDVMLYQSLLGRLVNYGDVEILTSSDIGVNKLRRISRPISFKRAMLDAKQELEGGSGRQGSIPRLISELADLRDRGTITEDEFQKEKAELLRRM